MVTSDGVALSWPDVYEEFAPAIANYARSRGIGDPENLAQDVFLAAVKQLRQFSGDRSGLRSLMFTIAYRRVADDLRRSQRRPEMLVADHSPQSAAGPTIEESVGQNETTSQAVAALSVLTDRERNVLELRIIEEASSAEVGATLGLSRGNVRVIQARALAKVRGHLRSLGVDSQSMFNVGLPFGIVPYLRTDLPTDGVLGAWIEALRSGDSSRWAEASVTANPVAGADASAVSCTVKAESLISSLVSSGIGRLGATASVVALGGITMSPVVASLDSTPAGHSAQKVEVAEAEGAVLPTVAAEVSRQRGHQDRRAAPSDPPSRTALRVTDPPEASALGVGEGAPPAGVSSDEDQAGVEVAADTTPGLVEKVLDPLVGQILEPVVDVVAGLVGGIVDHVVKGVVDPVVKDVVDPVVTGVVDPVVKDVVDPVVKDVVDPVVEEVVDPVVKDVVDPVAKDVVDPVVKDVDPVIEGVVDPVMKDVVDPVVKGVVDPVLGDGSLIDDTVEETTRVLRRIIGR